MNLLKQTLLAHPDNNFRPHLIRRHGLAFALMLVIGVQVVSTLQTDARPRVLGYATNISVSGLLSETNSERSAAGKSSLSLSGKLNTAAQGKANHMIANNYWAHTSPDGVTPWYWFDYADYDYLVAGENLAYGFNTSSGVINGWMNSSSHRSNMLNGAYETVGFGIANGSNYQGGANTVVVAHYGDPAVLAEASPPPAPKPKTANQPTAVAAQPVEAAPLPKKETKPKEKPDETAAPVEEEDTGGPALIEIASAEPKRISNLEALLSGQAGWALYTTSAVALLLGLVYAYRHIIFIHRAVVNGEHWLEHHPLLEASIVYLLIWLLLSGSFGSIL